jgi:hypothetical protein
MLLLLLADVTVCSLAAFCSASPASTAAVSAWKKVQASVSGIAGGGARLACCPDLGCLMCAITVVWATCNSSWPTILELTCRVEACSSAASAASTAAVSAWRQVCEFRVKGFRGK